MRMLVLVLLCVGAVSQQNTINVVDASGTWFSMTEVVKAIVVVVVLWWVVKALHVPTAPGQVRAAIAFTTATPSLQAAHGWTTLILNQAAPNANGLTNGTGFTVPIAGFYSVSATVTYAGTNTLAGTRGLAVARNNMAVFDAVVTVPVSSPAHVALAISSLLLLQAGDTVAIAGYADGQGQTQLTPPTNLSNGITARATIHYVG